MKKNTFYGLVLILAFILVAAPWLASPAAAADLKPARVDDASEKVFVVIDPKASMTNDLFIANVKQARAYVAKNKAGWSGNWSIAFFADAKYAFDKEDGKVKQYVADKSWHNSFLAEYSNKAKTLVFFPMDISMKEEIKVD
ncbi:hypothetical protein EPN96_12810 [bacterium]|nr:MAG: hypothetical protein EPN96_12810 [bacterium]